MVVSFIIPGEPRTKKNSQRIVPIKKKGGGVIYKLLPSDAYMSYEKQCKGYVPPYHIDNEVNVKALYYMGSHRRVDLCNLHEALCDILVKYGCVEDDSYKFIASMDGSRVLYDKDNPRVEVTITTV